MTQTAFWVAVGKIIWINVLLSGDNALVIAWPAWIDPRQRLWACLRRRGGGRAAHRLHGHRRDLDGAALLKLIGGLALIVIAAKLLVPTRTRETSSRPRICGLRCRSSWSPTSS